MILDLFTWTTIYLIYSRTICVFINPIVPCTSLLYCSILIVLLYDYDLSLSHSYYLVLLIVQDLDSLFCSVMDTHMLLSCVEQ